MEYPLSKERSKQPTKPKTNRLKSKDRKQHLPQLKKIKATSSLQKAGLNDPLQKSQTVSTNGHFGITQHAADNKRQSQQKFDNYPLKSDGLPQLTARENNQEQVYKQDLNKNKKLAGETLPQLLNKKNIIKTSFFGSSTKQVVTT